MDSYGYSFIAAVIMIIFGQPILAGLCFLAGIAASYFPHKKDNKWDNKNSANRSKKRSNT